MESWRTVWRSGFAPILSTAGLEALKVALETDDPRLAQGLTTTPPPLWCVQGWICEGCCPLAFCGVIDAGGFGVATVGDAEAAFSKFCFEADQRLGEPAACRWFLNAIDDTPRKQMFAELLAEVKLELARRGKEEPVSFDLASVGHLDGVGRAVAAVRGNEL